MRESMAVLHFLQQKFDRAIKIVLAYSNYWTRSVFAILSRFDFSINRWSAASTWVDRRRCQTHHWLTKAVYHQIRLVLSVFLVCASSFMVQSGAVASTDYANGEFPDITTNEDTCPVQYFDDGILNPNPTCLSVFERGDTMSDGNGGTLRWEQAVDENDNPLFDDEGNIIYSGNLVYGVPNQTPYWSSGTSLSNRLVLTETMASDVLEERLAIVKDPVVPCQAKEACLPGRYLEVSVDGIFIYGDGKNVIWQPRLAQPSAAHAKGVTAEGFRLQLNSADQQVELVNNHTGHIRWTSNDGYIPPPKVVYSLHTGTYTEDEQLMDIGQRKFLRFSRLNRGDVLLSIEENTFMQLNKATGILELGQLPDDRFQVNINYDNEPDFVEKRRYIGLFDNENHLNSFFETGSEDSYVFQGESFLREEGLLYYDVDDGQLRYLQAGSSSGVLTWVSAANFIQWQEPITQATEGGIDRFEITDGGYRYLNLDAQGNVIEEVVKIEGEDDQDIIFSLRPQFCGITYTDAGGNDHDIEYCPMAWTFDLEHQEAGAPWEDASSVVVSGTSSALANRSSEETSKTPLSSQAPTLWDFQQSSLQAKNTAQQATDSRVQMGLEDNHRNPGVRYSLMLAKQFGHRAWLNVQWYQNMISQGFSYLNDAPRMVVHNTLATIEPVAEQLTKLVPDIPWVQNYLTSAKQLMGYAAEELATQLIQEQQAIILAEHLEGWVESALVSATFIDLSQKIAQQNDPDLLTNMTKLHQNLSSGISSSPQLKNFFTMAGYEGPWQDQTAPSGASKSDVTPFADRALTDVSTWSLSCNDTCRWLTKEHKRFDFYPFDFRAMTKYPKGTSWRLGWLREKLSCCLPSDETLDGLMRQYSFQGSRLFITWPKQTYKKLPGDDHEKLYTYMELRARALNIAGVTIKVDPEVPHRLITELASPFINRMDGGLSFLNDWILKAYWTTGPTPKVEFGVSKSSGIMGEFTPSAKDGQECAAAAWDFAGSVAGVAGHSCNVMKELVMQVFELALERIGEIELNGVYRALRDYLIRTNVPTLTSNSGQMFSDNMRGRSLSDHVAANSLTNDTDTLGINTILLEALGNLFTLWSSKIGWSDEEQTTFASDPALAYLSSSGKIVIGHLLNSTKRLMDCATTTSDNGDEVPNCTLQPRPLSDLMSLNTDTDSFDFKNGMSDDIIFSMPALMGLCDTNVFPARDDCPEDDNYWSDTSVGLGSDTEASLIDDSLNALPNTTAMQLLEDLYALADTRFRVATGVADQENIYGCNDDDPSWVCPHSVADRLALLKARFPSDNKLMQRFIHLATETETESQSSPARQLSNCNSGFRCFNNNPFTFLRDWSELEIGGYIKPYIDAYWDGKSGDALQVFGGEILYGLGQFGSKRFLLPCCWWSPEGLGPHSLRWIFRDTVLAAIAETIPLVFSSLTSLNTDNFQTSLSGGWWGALLIIPWSSETDYFERDIFGELYYRLNMHHDWQRDKVRDLDAQLEYSGKRRFRFQLNWDSGDHFGGTGKSTFNWTETDTTTYQLGIQSDTANPNIGTTLTASVVESSTGQEIDLGLLKSSPQWVWQRCDPDASNCTDLSNNSQTYTLQAGDANKLIKAELTFGFKDQNLKTYVASGESIIQPLSLVLELNGDDNITLNEGEILTWSASLSDGWGNHTCGLSGKDAHQFNTVQSVSNNGTVCTYKLMGYDEGKPDYELQSTFDVVIGGSDQNNDTKTQEIAITVTDQGTETITLNCGNTTAPENTITHFECAVDWNNSSGYMAPRVREHGFFNFEANETCLSINNQTYDGTTLSFYAQPETDFYGECSVTVAFTNSQGVHYSVNNIGGSALQAQNDIMVINRVKEQMQWSSTSIYDIISVDGSPRNGWQIFLAALPVSSDFVTLDSKNYTCEWKVNDISYNKACDESLSVYDQPVTVAVTVRIYNNNNNYTLPFPDYKVTSEPWTPPNRRLAAEAVQNHTATGTDAIDADHRSLAEASHETATSVGGSEGIVALEDTIQIIHTGETIPLADGGLSFTWYQCSVQCWWDDGSNWQQLDYTGTELSVNQADVGSLVKVDICYKDDPTDADQPCYFGSATVEVQNFNNDATGMPSIEGNPVVGQTLWVDVSAIADEDGLPLSGTSDFAYQWVRLDTPAGTKTTIGSEASYDISEDDIGHTLVVRVSFVDLYGHGESRESDPSGVIGLSNQPPVAVDTYVSTAMGQPFAFNLMATDANGDTLTYQRVEDESVSEPPGGTLIIASNGVATYTPAADFSGTDRFYFSVADTAESSPAAVVTIAVHEGYLAGTSVGGTPIQPTMLGHTLVGDFSDDDTGSLVVFDDSGTLMAVSSPGVDNGQTGVANAGHVAVYAWDDTDHHWQQRGNHLLGSAETDSFGKSLALSGDGNVLAVGSPGAGHVQIYRFDAEQNQWLSDAHQLSFTEAENTNFGHSIAFNGDASMLAIGAPNADRCVGVACQSGAGAVMLYQSVADSTEQASYSWLSIKRLQGSDANQHFGKQVVLSGRGDRLIIVSTPDSVRGGSIVHTFLRHSTDWTESIEDKLQYLGHLHQLALSADGETLVTGLPGFGEDRGWVSILRYDSAAPSSRWRNQRTLLGDVPGEKLGTSVAVSSDGRVVAAGAIGDNDTISNYVKWFYWDQDTDNYSAANQLDNQQSDALFGVAVALSSDGTRLTVGAPNFEGNQFVPQRSGMVQAYALTNNNAQISGSLDDSVLWGGSVSGHLHTYDTAGLAVDPIAAYQINDDDGPSLAQASVDAISGEWRYFWPSDGTTYTTGQDSFVVTITDALGITYEQPIAIEVLPVNTAPEAFDVSLTVPRNNALPQTILFESNDREGDDVSFKIDTYPQHGVLENCAGGRCDYRVSGTTHATADGFTYSACDASETYLCSDPAEVSLTIIQPNGSVEIGHQSMSQDFYIGEVVVAVITDEDGVLESISPTYVWSRAEGDNTYTTLGEGSSYQLVAADAGKHIILSVSYVDNQGVFEFHASPSIVPIHADQPGTVVLSGMNDNGTVAVGMTLTATFDDPDGYDQVIYRWQRAVDTGEWHEIGQHGHSPAYTLIADDIARFVRLRVHYNDLISGAYETVYSTPVKMDSPGILNITHDNSTVYWAKLNKPLVADLHDDDDLVNVVVDYVWQRQDVDTDTGAVGWTAITNADGSAYEAASYTPIASDGVAGHYIRVLASYTDNRHYEYAGDSAVVSNTVRVDSPGVISFDKTNPKPGHSITASLADSDGYVVSTLDWQWQRRLDANHVWQDIDQQTTDHIKVGAKQTKGYDLRVCASYTDSLNIHYDWDEVCQEIPNQNATRANTLVSCNWYETLLGTCHTYQTGVGELVAMSRVVDYSDTESNPMDEDAILSIAQAEVNDNSQFPYVTVRWYQCDPDSTACGALDSDDDAFDLSHWNMFIEQTDFGGVSGDTAEIDLSQYDNQDAIVGDHIVAEVCFVDGTAHEENATGAADGCLLSPATIAVENVQEEGTVELSGTAEQGQTLTATVSDDDGISGAIAYQWKRGSTLIGTNSATYVLVQADVGSTITVNAQYTDNQSTAENVTSAATGSVTNVNDAGSVIISGTAEQGQTLTATVSDDDGTSGAIAYQWYRSNIDFGTCISAMADVLCSYGPITGATEDTYIATQADVGYTLKVQVTYTDDQGTDETLTSAATAAVVGSNTPPQAIGDTATVEEDGSASIDVIGNDTDVDGDTLMLTSVSTSGSGTVAVNGDGVSVDYTPAANFNGNESITYTVSDGVETDTGSLTITVTAVNDNGAVDISGTARQRQTLTANVTDADGLSGAVTSAAMSYQWYRLIGSAVCASDNPLCGYSEITGATEDTYKATQADVGYTLKVQVTYTDDQGTDETLTSAATGAIENVNDAPTGRPQITGNAIVENTVHATQHTLDDADGIAHGTITYKWYTVGETDVEVHRATGSSYTIVEGDEGEYLYIRAHYTDNYGGTHQPKSNYKLVQ